jgi:3-hydroxyisobutyrate dehydrogenase-like beta-hydroxyacid dehydrogenase
MSNNATRPGPVIGILYPGEMGSSLGKVLTGNGLRVVTTLEGRSAHTRRLCYEAGLEVLPSFDEVARTAEITISLVPPAQALPLAKQYRTAARTVSSPLLYIDANSISPVTAMEIAALFADTHVSFVDAAIYGMASQLLSRGIVYLSGPLAAQAVDTLGRSLRTRIVGDTPGKASALKSLIAGLNKGLVALFLEMGLLGRQMGLFDELLASYRTIYPGVMEVVDRLLPTYPQHAARRGQEMAELERTMRSHGLRPCVVRGAREVITAFAQRGLADQSSEAASPPWTVPGVVEELFRHSLAQEYQRP